MQKRGQITLFVILGIILVILIVFMFYYRSAVIKVITENVLQREVVLPTDVKKVQTQVRSCVNDMGLILFYQLGAQGGILNPTESNGLVTDDYSIAYGYNGKNVLPTLVDFRRDFSDFMNSYLPACLQLSDFGKLTVKGSRPVTKLDFLDDKVKVSVDYPVTVTEGDSTYNIKESYLIEYPLRVKLLHDLSDGIVRKTVSDPKNIDVSYLLGLGIKVDIYPYDNKTLIYSLQDSKSVYRNVPYEYRFAVRHTK